MTLSHLDEYESPDADSSGSHRSRFSVRRGRGYNEYHVTKTYSHADYDWLSMERRRPGSRDEERRHFVRFYNGSFLRSSDRHIVGHMPHTSDGKRPDVVLGEGEHRMRMRAVSKLSFRQICNDYEKRNRRSVGHSNVASMTKDGVAVSHKIPKGKSIPLAMFGDETQKPPTDINQLLDCVDESVPTLEQSKCVLKLKDLVRKNDFLSRRVVDVVCREMSPSSYRWKYVVQVLGESHYGQECLIKIVSNASLPASHRLRALSSTRDIVDPHSRLIDVLFNLSCTTSDHVTMGERRAAVSALGVIARVARAGTANTIVTHLESRLRSHSVRGHVHDHVATYARALGNAAHNKSFLTLSELVQHPSANVRSIALFGLRRYNWSDVEPIYVEMLKSATSTSEEHVAAVKAMIGRVVEVTDVAVETLAVLYRRSIDERLHSESTLREFFTRRTDPASLDALRRGERLRSAREVKETLVKRSLRSLDPLKPLVDSDFGIDKSFSFDIGALDMKSALTAGLRNLVQTYLSIFDGQFVVDSHNEAKTRLHMFDLNVDLVDAQALFVAGVAFKNSLLSNLLNRVLDTAGKVVGEVRNAIAPLVVEVLRTLDFLENEFSDISRLIAPIQPIIDGFNRGVNMLDMAINASYVAESYIDAVDDYVLQLRNLDMAGTIIAQLEIVVDSFLKPKLANLTAMCHSVVVYVTEPIDRLSGYVANVTNIVNSITDVVDSFPDEPATQFGLVVCQIADQILNFNASVILDVPAVSATLAGVSDKLLGVVESAGLSTFYRVLDMAKNFTTFINKGAMIVDGLRRGFVVGDAVAKELVTQFQTFVSRFKSTLNSSKAVIDDLRTQLSGDSVVGQVTNIVEQLGFNPIFSSDLVDAGLDEMQAIVDSVESAVCGTVNTTLVALEAHVDAARRICYEAASDLADDVVGFLKNASEEIFGTLPFNGSRLDTIDVFQISHDLLEREVDLVKSFLNDKVLTHFDEYALSFVESVNETIAENLDAFVVWFEGQYVDDAKAYLNGSREFIKFVATAKNVTDLVAVVLRGVPGVEALKNVIDSVLDTTLNVAGWIQSVLEFLTKSESFVSAGEKVRHKILNWIQFGFAKFRSILAELLNKFSAALLQAGNVAMSYLSGGLQFVQNVIDSVLSLVDVIENFVANVLQNVRNVATNLKSTLLSSCAFSFHVDVVVTFGDTIRSMQTSWNELVKATTSSASEQLIATTTALLAPISSLAEKISNFLGELYMLTYVYTSDWASYVDFDCVDGTLCVKLMFSDDLERIIQVARNVIEKIGLLADFLDIVGDVDKYVEMLLDMMGKVRTNLKLLLDFALSTVTEKVVDLANSALDLLVPKADRQAFGATCSSLVSGFPLVAKLNSVAQLGNNAWHGVSDALLSAGGTCLRVAKDFSKNLVNLCNYFTVLGASSYIMKPASKIINSVVSLGLKLQSLVEEPIFSGLRLATDVVLGFRFVVSDIKRFISDEIVRRIDNAIVWLETKPLELLKTVRGWIATLLLIDTGLAPGTLADPSELPYCSVDTCVQVMRRSTDTYRNVVFKVKYTHLTVLERDRTIIPGLFENYQVQGVAPIDREGSHYVLSMFGTEDKLDNPNLLVVQAKGSGVVKRIFRVLDTNGTAVRGRFGVLVVQDWLYLHGVDNVTVGDGGTVGLLYGIRKESLEPLTEVGAPKDVTVTLKVFTDSFGTGMFYAANESYLWISDFLDSKGNMLSGDPLPKHHVFDAASGQKGWIAGYATDISGQIETSSKYKPGDLPVEVVKPSEILTIGENVAGAVSFVQENIEFFAILRCVAKPGFSCKLDFIEPPYAEDTSFNGISVMYGVNLELDRSVRVPSGAVDVGFIEKGESLVVTHNSGAQAEQRKREVIGGDLEDSTISLAVPVLRNLFDPSAVTSNRLSLVVDGEAIVDEELISFGNNSSSLRRRRKKRQEDENASSDCYTSRGEIYNVDKIFYKTCEFPFADPTCDSKWIVVAEYMGIILSLEFAVSGRVVVNYEAELCPISQQVTARLLPHGSLTLSGAVTVTIGIASASLRLDITLLDTTFVPSLDVGIRGDVLKACADFKVITKPITVTMSVGFGIMGPTIQCPSWKIWECTFGWGPLFTVWQVLFSWSCPTQELTIVPEICFATPDVTPPETSVAVVVARQNDAQSFTVDMVGFGDPESEWLHFTVTAKPTSGVVALVDERDVQDAQTATIGDMRWSHGSHVAVTVTCHNSAGLTSSVTAEPFLVDLLPAEVVKFRDGNETLDIDYDCSYNAIRATYDDIVDEESDVAVAKWAIGTKKGGEELQPFTDILQTQYLTNSNLVLKHNTTYYVSLRTINSVSVEGITSTDGVLIDHTKPLVDSSVTPVKDGSYDCVADYDYQLAQESFKACWLGIYDVESGMDYFHWTIADSFGRRKFEAERVKHFFAYKDGLLLTAKETYVAVVVAFNRAGLSSQYLSDGMMVDITNPVCSEIEDLNSGVDGDADFSANLTHFGASWTCRDPESGIAAVQAAIGTYKGGTRVLPFEDVGFGPNGTTRVIFPPFPFWHATRYFVTGRAVNKAGLITTFWSDGILVDETPPSVGAIYLRDGDGDNDVHSPDVDFQASDEEICARWKNAFVDMESPVENYYVSVYGYNGTMVQEELDVMLKSTVCFSRLALQNGAIYRVVVRAQNAAGLSTTIETDGVLVDATSPRGGALYDGQNFGVDIDAWTERTSAFGNFKVCQSYETVDFWPPNQPFRPPKRPCADLEFFDKESGVSYVETSVIDKNGVEMASWQYAAPTFYSMGRVIHGRQGGFYRFVVRAYNFAGRRTEATSNGTVVDTTYPFLEDLIEYDYDGPNRRDIDYLEKPDVALGVSWFAHEDVTEIVARDWAIGSYSGGTDLLDFTSPTGTNSTHHRLSSLSLGHSYYATVRITNSAGLRTVLTTDGFLVDYRPPSEGYVQDGWNTYDIDYQTTGTTAWCLWRWIDDCESGIAELLVGVSEKEAADPMSYVNVSRLADRAIIRDLDLLSGKHVYVCNVKAIDFVGYSSVSTSNGFVVVTSPPICSGSVYDGESGEADITSLSDVFVARWDPCYDEGTAVEEYLLGIAIDSAGEAFAYPFQSFGNLLMGRYQNVALNQSSTYYAVVRVVNSAGLTTTFASDGVQIDATPPVCSHIGDGPNGDVDFETTPRFAAVNWNCFEDVTRIVNASWTMGVYRYDDSVFAVSVDAYAFEGSTNTIVLPDGIKFYSALVLINEVGLRSVYVTDGFLVDTSPPTVNYVYDGLDVGLDAEYQATVVDISANWLISDVQSGVSQYVVVVSPPPVEGDDQTEVVGQSEVTMPVVLNQGSVYSIGLRYYTDIGSLHVTWDSFIDNETSIVEYYVCVGGSVSKCDILPSTYVGLTLYYDVDSNIFTPGNKSYVTVTAINSVGLVGHASSDEIVVDRSAPVAGRIEVAGGKLVSSLDPFVVRWSDFYDNESRIDFYEWSLCLEDVDECAVSLENVRKFTEVTKNGIDGLLDGRCYVARVVAHNNAGLLTQSESKCVVFDSTPPEAKGKLLFVAENTEESSQRMSVSLKWEPILDRESFVHSLRLCVLRTQTKACDETISVTPTTSSEISLRLRLDRNETYYASLTATNGVLLESILISSSLKFYSTAPRDCRTVVDGSEQFGRSYQASTTSVSSNWFGFSGSIVDYRWGVGTTPHDADVLPFADVGRRTSAFAAGIRLEPGKVFYNLVEATNRFGETFLVASSGFTVDDTAPVIDVVRLGRRGDVYGPYEAWTGTITFFWSVDGDKESGIESTTWSFCANHSCAVTNVVVRNATSVSTSLAVALGACYYAEVSVKNGAGLASAARSQCTVFDDSPPEGGVVIDGNGSRDRQYQSSTSRMSFHWSDFYDPESSVSRYSHCIGSSPFGHDVRACHDVSNATLKTTVGGLKLEHGRTYFATVYAVNRAGLSRPVCSSGVVVDVTPPVAGPVLDGATRPDIDYSNSSSTVLASWDQFDDLSPISNCSWWAGSRKYHSNIVPRTGIELSTRASSTGHSIPSGWHVFVSVACANSAGMTTTAHSNGYIVDTTPPTVGSARFTLSGHPAPSYLSDVASLALSWVGFYENETSLSHYSFALMVTGKLGKTTEDFISTGLLSDVSLEGTGLVVGLPYKAKVRAYNLVGLHSQVKTKTHIIVDRSMPETGQVADGTGVEKDVNFQSNSTHLSAHWMGFLDPQSGIRDYEACYGYDNANTTLGCQRADSKNLYVDFYGVHLLHGSRYTVTVYAVNRVNLTSVPSRSNGVLIDLTPPSAGEVYDAIDFADINYQTSPTVFSVSWTDFVDEESDVEYYTWKANVNMTYYHMTYISERNVGLSMHAIASGHVLPSGTHVVSIVKAINRAGLETEVQSDGVTVDLTRPLGGIVYDGRPDDGNDKDYFATQSLVSAYWTGFIDPESGIAGYSYAVFEHSFDESTNSWSLGVVVATMVNLTEFHNFTIAVDGGMKPGYRYTVAVMGHNGAGLTVTVTSDGFRYVPNDLCFAVDSRRASRDLYQLSGTIELDEPARVLCPSNYSSNDSSNILTPSTHFEFTVLRENASQGNGTENNSTVMVEIMNSTDIGKFVSPRSPCCREIGALPVSYVTPHMSYKLLNFDVKSTSKLISSRRMALADARSLAFMKISDTSQKRTFLTNSTSTDAPRLYVSGDETVAIVYSDRFLLVDSSGEFDVSMKGYVTVENVCQSVLLSGATTGTFCSVVSLENSWASAAVNVHCGDKDYVVFGVMSPSGNGLELTWTFLQTLVTKSSTCGFEMSSDEFGNVLFKDSATLSLFNCQMNDQCSSIADRDLGDILSAKLLPKTNVIVVLHGSRSIAFYSFDFGLICETVQLESPLLNFMEVDQYSFSNDTQVLTIGSNHLYVTLFQNSFVNVGGCQQIGGVELTSDYLPHTVSIKDEMIAFGSPDANDDHLRMHLAAYCNAGNERNRKSVDSFVLECYPCDNKRSSGGGHDDCTRCFETHCFFVHQATIDVVSPRLDLESGAKYTIEVAATNEADKETTVSSQRIVVDFTPPVVGLVHNGDNQSDIVYAGSTDYVLVVSWSSFYDTESEIMAYLWCVGSSPGECDMSPMKEVAGNVTQVVCDACIGKFVDGVTYFSTVVAVNWALRNSSNSSLGLLIDLTPPVIGFVREGDSGSVDLDFQMATTYLKANWAADDFESGIYEYNVVVVPGNFRAAAGNQTEWIFNHR